MRVFPYDRVPDGDVLLDTNLFTNPNLVGDSTWAEVRRNLFTQPRAGTLFGRIDASSRTVVELIPGGGIKAARAEPGGNAGIDSTGFPVTLGATYSISFDLENIEDHLSSAVMQGHNAIPGQVMQIVGNRVGVTFTSNFTGNARLRVQLGPDIGAFFILDKVLFEQATNVGPYFDGSAPSFTIDPDMRQRWLGTPNASESVMEGEEVRGLTASNCVAIVSTKAGKPAVRLIPNGIIGSNVTCHVIISIPEAARGGGTFVGTVFAEQETPRSPTARRELIVEAPLHRAGRAVVGVSTAQRLSFGTLGSTYQARLYGNGQSYDAGDVWWTDIGLFAGDYAGEAFSGSSHDDGDIFYEWAGPVDNSPSRKLQRTFIPVQPDTNPHTIIEVDLDPSVAAVTVWRDDGKSWERVRGAINVPVSGAWSGVDWECGFNRVTSYRVEQFDAGGNSLGFLPGETVTLGSEHTWVHNVLAPRDGVIVGLTSKALEVLDRPYQAEMVYPRGRSRGVAVGSGRRGLSDVSLELYTSTLSQADKVQALLGSDVNPLPPSLVIRKGMDADTARIPATLHLFTPTIVEAPIDVRYGGEWVTHEIVGHEASPPTPKLSTPLLTRGDLSAAYATRAARSADNISRVAVSRRWDLAGYATI